MNYKYAIVFLITFVIVFVVAKYLRQSAYIHGWFSKQTRIDFNQRSFDFGTIPLKRVANIYFVFTNKGSNDLKIESIDARCGCTVAEWPKTIIRPNRKDSILVQYDAVEEGFFLKEVYVFSNSETSPDLLSVKGIVSSSSPF